MKIVENLVKGPFKDEREFKRAVLTVWRKTSLIQTFFEIENEEKAPGMPDVLAVSRDYPAHFIEFKYADKKRVISFQKTQPLFYRQHPKLRISVLAWDSRGGRVVYVSPEEVIAASSLAITLPEFIGQTVKYV
jgi:hypothetical protein